MEFADLIYDFLREEGIKAHIQPGFGTPSGWASQAYNENGSTDIDFGEPIVVRAVQIGLERPYAITIWHHPQTQNIYIHYYRPFSKKERLRRSKGYGSWNMSQNGSPQSHARGKWSWPSSCPKYSCFNLEDPDSLEKLKDKIYRIRTMQDYLKDRYDS